MTVGQYVSGVTHFNSVSSVLSLINKYNVGFIPENVFHLRPFSVLGTGVGNQPLWFFNSADKYKQGMSDRRVYLEVEGPLALDNRFYHHNGELGLSTVRTSYAYT